MIGLRRLLFWLIVLIAVIVALAVPLSRRAQRAAGAAPETAGPARRGSIFDRNGRVLAFDDTTGESRLRSYPVGETLATLIGLIGKAGLEYSLDSVIKPKSRPLGGFMPGSDVTLTIDLNLQRSVFLALKRGVEGCRAKQGSAIVLDPRSGEVLALADYPSFDPHKYKLYPAEVWQCHGVTDDFAPGPAFQMVPALALPGSLNLPAVRDPRRFADTALALTVDPKLLQAAADKLGFSGRTGIEVPAEAVGAQPDEAQLRAHPELLFRAVQGQGIQTSLVQLAEAWMRIVDNTGRRPFVVKQVRNAGKITYDHPADRLAPLMKDSLIQMVENVFVAHPSSYEAVCGAGGIAIQDSAGSAEGLPLLVWVGISPVPSARYVVAVMVDQPLTGHYAPETAAQLFLDIAHSLP